MYIMVPQPTSKITRIVIRQHAIQDIVYSSLSATLYMYRMVNSRISYISFLLLLVVLVCVAPKRCRAQSNLEDERIRTIQRTIVYDLVAGDPQAATEGSNPAGVPRSSVQERAWAAAYIRTSLELMGLQPQLHRYQWPNKNGFLDLLFPPYKGINVFSFVEATVATDEVILLGAHYDSEKGSPGAGDNAAGVALVASMASLVNQLNTRHKHFLFVLFDQEEDDAVGSRAFVSYMGGYLSKRSYSLHSAFITDLIGWDEDGDGVIEIQAEDPEAKTMIETAAKAQSIPIRFTEGSSSDRVSFNEAGYRSVGIFGDITSHYHRSSDLPETVDFDFLLDATHLLLTLFTFEN